ncbi:hypothetical protein V2G26_005624 [Clonostachys chloroleuca]
MSGLWISVEPCLDPMIVYMLTLDIPAQKQPSSFVWLGQGKSHGIQMSLSTIGKLSSVARGFTGGRKPPRNYPIHGLAILTHSTSTLGSKDSFGFRPGCKTPKKTLGWYDLPSSSFWPGLTRASIPTAPSIFPSYGTVDFSPRDVVLHGWPSVPQPCS